MKANVPLRGLVAIAVIMFALGWGAAGLRDTDGSSPAPTQPGEPRGITIGQFSGLCDQLRDYAEDPSSLSGCDAAVSNIIDEIAGQAAQDAQNGDGN